MSTKIAKIVSDIAGLSVLEIAELRKGLEEALGVTAAMPMMGGAVAAPVADASAKKEEEKTEYKVELMDAGPDKIKTIKAVRQVKKDLGLTEAKKLVEETPSLIAEAAPKAEAMTMKEVLEAAGAKVKLT